MALLRKLLNKPPDGLLVVYEKIYVFTCCFTAEAWAENDYKAYVGNVVSEWKVSHPESAIIIPNFREGDSPTRIASALSDYDITIIDFPWHYEGCPVLSLEVIHHFLKTCESWFSANPQHAILMHAELGGWPVVAFMVAALLTYKKLVTPEIRALELVLSKPQRDLSTVMPPLNPQPSQLRYLQYVSKSNEGTEWPPGDKALTLDCVIIRMIPDFDGKGGCCPVFRIYGRDPLLHVDKNTKLLFSTPRKSKNVRYYNQKESELVKIDLNCHIQGDIVLECINLHEDLVCEKIMYRAMFNTAFIKSHTLILDREEMDMYSDVKDKFPKDFKAELLFSEMDVSAYAVPVDLSELETLFSAHNPSDKAAKAKARAAGNKPEKVHLIEHRRAYNCEIMLSKVKTPLPEIMEFVLRMDDSADIDHVENLIKFCPTKEEMEQIKNYKGEKEKLGKCEEFFMELMRVPRSEAKLRAFSYKLQFNMQVSDLRGSLNDVYLSVEQIRSSVKLRRVMLTILSLGNALNQGTARGAAVGFRLDTLLKLNETRARNNKMTLMHYLCKVLADKLPELLDFSKELTSLEPASKIQLKILEEEMQTIQAGLHKVIREKKLCKKDGHVSKKFRKSLKKFLAFAKPEVANLAKLYSGVGKSVDGLIQYFGEDVKRCPYEQVVSTLLSFVRMFNQAHEDNCKQIELDRKKALKEEQERLKQQIQANM